MPVRNLLYFVCPFGNYKWNIEQLLTRWNVFTGTKVIYVAQDKNLDAIGVVEKLFPKDAVLEPIQNHLILRETHAFPALLLHASKFDRASCSYFLHTKGTTRKGSPAVDLWTLASYKFLLDDIQKTDALLAKFPIVGSFKRRGKFLQFPGSLFHYSGSFFAWRNKDVFAKPNWFDVAQARYGCEGWPGRVFRDEEAGCIFGDGIGDLYRWSYITELLKDKPEFSKFIADNNNLGMRWDTPRKFLK